MWAKLVVGRYIFWFEYASNILTDSNSEVIVIPKAAWSNNSISKRSKSCYILITACFESDIIDFNGLLGWWVFTTLYKWTNWFSFN